MSIVMRIFGVTFLSILLLFPHVSCALRQYRCGGMVQFRPCDEPPPPSQAHNYSRTEDPMTLGRARANQSVTAPVKVEKVTFKQVSSSEGHWRGYLKGRGSIALRLYIMRNGKVETTKYMGSVTLKSASRSIPFNFISTTPSEPGWSWRIVPFVA